MKTFQTIKEAANLKGMAKHTYNRVMSAMADDNEPSMCHTFAALTDGAKEIALQSGKFSNLYIRGERKGMAAEEAAKELTERAAACVSRKLRKIDMVCAVAFLAEYISRQRKADKPTTEPTDNTPSTMNAKEITLTAESAAAYNAMLTPSEGPADLAWESEPKTDEELTSLGVDAFGGNDEANETTANGIRESISRLRYELQQYTDNASKGGQNRRRNMILLRWDIRNLERQLSANEITVTIHQIAPGHWQASANGVKFGWVCTWFHNTFAACMNIGIREQKAFAPLDLWNEQRGTHGHETESAAVASLSEMIKSYFAKYGYNAKVLNV